MLKRVLLLLFIFVGFTSGSFSQVLSVDSVEVDLIIPDHQKSRIMINPDSIEDVDNTAVLQRLMKLDSLYSDQRWFSSGRIKIKTSNYLNRFIRKQVLRRWDRNRLFSNVFFEGFHNPWSLSPHWKESSMYNPYAMSLKYKERDNDLFVYDTSVQLKPSVQEYQNFLRHPARVDTLMEGFDRSLAEELTTKALYDRPDFADELWSEIPDPPKFSYGEGYIHHRSANESISSLLQWDTPETNRKLQKKKAIQRTWVYGGTENIQVSQAFQENWVKGGENSVALLSDLRLQARYKKNNVEWESYIIHKLGILNTEEKKARFNDDLIELNSKYGLSAGKKWFYSGLLNFKTQFFNGYESSDTEKENPVSGFMAPGYLTMALGMDYKEKNFTLMILPFTSKMTIVTDTVKFDQTRYKIPEDKKIDNMGGASIVNSFSRKIAKDFNLRSKMDFFYEYMRDDNQIQAEWELILDMQINVFLSTRIATYLRYYSNESEYVQFRENLSISFNYKF